MKRTASQAECFHGTHRSRLIGGASPFLFLVSDAVSSNCRRGRLKRQGRGGDELGKVRGSDGKTNLIVLIVRGSWTKGHGGDG